jgi:hypothetical protein
LRLCVKFRLVAPKLPAKADQKNWRKKVDAAGRLCEIDATHGKQQHRTTLQMKTKSLLIAAATLAAGIISSQAAVYSQNIVGYVNVVTPVGKYSFIANQLTNGNNSINSVVATGSISDPNATYNTQIFVWNGNGYNIYQWFTGADADNNFLATGSVNGWYDAGGVLAPDNLNPGSGAFLYNPTGSGSPVTNTFVGSIIQGTNAITVTKGYNVYSLIPPVSTNIDGAFASFPGKSDPNGLLNDQMYIWNGNGYNIALYFTGTDADNNFLVTGSVNGWYDAGGTYLSTNTGYQPKVAQAFFIYRDPSQATNSWTYSFQVQ